MCRVSKWSWHRVDVRGLGGCFTPMNIKETSLCQSEAGSWKWAFCIKQENSRGCLTCDIRSRTFWPSVQGHISPRSQVNLIYPQVVTQLKTEAVLESVRLQFAGSWKVWIRMGWGTLGSIKGEQRDPRTHQLWHHLVRAGLARNINKALHRGPVTIKQSCLAAFSLASTSGLIKLMRHLVFFRTPRQAMTSAAMTPILTLDTQMTGSTGKLGLVGCLWL